MPICGLKFDVPLLEKSKPKPVEPIVVLSHIITLSSIIEFFIDTLFLIIVFFLICTPLPIIQFLPIFTESSILLNLEMYDPFKKINSSL